MLKLAKCPACLNRIDIGPKPLPYERFECPTCETSLELVKINPPVLDWTFSDNEAFYDNLEFAVWSL